MMPSALLPAPLELPACSSLSESSSLMFLSRTIRRFLVI